MTEPPHHPLIPQPSTLQKQPDQYAVYPFSTPHLKHKLGKLCILTLTHIIIPLLNIYHIFIRTYPPHPLPKP